MGPDVVAVAVGEIVDVQDSPQPQPLIVTGWDGTDRARDALALAAVLARALAASVRVVASYRVGYPYSPAYIEGPRDLAIERLEAAPRELLPGVVATREAVPGLSPAEGLQRDAERSGAEIIVVGSTHRGRLGRVMPGAVADHLLHGSPCAVAVAPVGYADSAPERLEVVAAAYDGSPEAHAAAEHAVRLARDAGARVDVISIVPPFEDGWGGPGSFSRAELLEMHERFWRDQLDAVVDELPGDVPIRLRLEHGAPAAALAEACRTGVDLLVLGSRGYGTVRRVLLGSVSSEAIELAHCPVLVIPRSARD